jgi:GDPmannose 4,6-dehydratase
MTDAVALITGITGQDGYYLSDLLLRKGYVVHGVVRRTSEMRRLRLDRLLEEHPDYRGRLSLHYGDVTDSAAITRLVLSCKPAEVYNLAAQSHVRVSFDKPGYTQAVNGEGALNVLSAVRLLAESQPVKFLQASTSEMFGGMPGTAPQNESTPFHPRSPYATSKVTAHHHTVNAREAYGLFACAAICFNHESPMRGENFVTRKITRAATRIKEGLQDELRLGNLDAKRDWGFAGDYVEAMWLMLQQDEPDDYVIASGETHSVREFLDVAFAAVALDWQDYVAIDERYLRPSEVEVLQGDASKARRVLGWEPKTSFEELVRLMIEQDWELARREKEQS